VLAKPQRFFSQANSSTSRVSFAEVTCKVTIASPPWMHIASAGQRESPDTTANHTLTPSTTDADLL
jgi:hypothetical protein